MKSRPCELAFTLAELLIALAILGVIATFTIPKVLQSQQDGRKNAIAKEAAAAISAAYQTYSISNTPTSSLSADQLMSYFNYVKQDTTSLIDDVPTMGSKDCSVKKCYLLHNGAMLMSDGDSFGAPTDTQAVVSFFVDPDASYSGQTTGAGKSVKFYLYFNGRIGTEASKKAGMHHSGFTWASDGVPADDPPWFTWN